MVQGDASASLTGGAYDLIVAAHDASVSDHRFLAPWQKACDRVNGWVVACLPEDTPGQQSPA